MLNVVLDDVAACLVEKREESVESTDVGELHDVVEFTSHAECLLNEAVLRKLDL